MNSYVTRKLKGLPKFKVVAEKGIKNMCEMTECGFINHMVQPIRSCATFKFTKPWIKRQGVLLRMVGEYGSYMLPIVL